MLGFMSSISQPRTYSSGVYVLSNHFRRKYSSVNICKSVLPSSNNLRVYQSCKINLTYSEKVGTLSNTMVRLSRLGLRSRCRSMSLRMPIPSHEKVSKFKWNLRRTLLTGGSSLGLFLSFSASGRVNAESSMRDKNENASSGSSVSCSHGKKVYTDYSITGIPGDGRCLFRSVAHGACIRSGEPLPNEALQRELADNLRERVADEFVKRRAETEWFVEGDFDAYVSQIRKPHVWGGEPELFMASHVLQMPITVYMHDEDSGGLISIAEYGQEYGKDDPIQVLYHGFGHYDALHIPGNKGNKSRL